jgi:hypothetical protein
MAADANDPRRDALPPRVLPLLSIVGPMALRMPLPVRRGDYVAYALLVIGLVGMVAGSFEYPLGNRQRSRSVERPCVHGSKDGGVR